MTDEEKVQALKNVHDLADLPDEQLLWFAGNTTEMRLEPGEILFKKGDSPDYMIVFLTGETHALRDENMRDGFVYIARAGDPATEITGKLPFSRMQQLEATSRAVEPTHALLFPVRLYPELFQKMPALVERLVWKMSDRVRETTKTDEQRDKLMALGKLSAGLAHELNNPAAAARRAANELNCALEKLRAADLNLCQHELDAQQSRFLADFERAKISDLYDQKPLDSLAQSDLEENIGDWLDEREIENGWEYAAALAEAAVQTNELIEFETKLGAAAGDALARVASQITVAKLVSDINASSARISELVGAIKEYTYMDRAAVQDVDVHRALDNTLLILKYKLKKKNVAVKKEFDEHLPRIVAFGSELNQMWTNLIDNAIDAMPAAGGELKIRTKQEPNAILVEIRDNGAGIPAENQAHIFEPFFTTKPIGEGTGLGLDTVARIARRHRAIVRFESKPGDTCFQIRLPLDQND